MKTSVTNNGFEKRKQPTSVAKSAGKQKAFVIKSFRKDLLSDILSSKLGEQRLGCYVCGAKGYSLETFKQFCKDGTTS
jgi:hypothetical protein